MNAIRLPELDPDLQAWLSRRAANHGVSLEEEVAAILRREQAREAPAASCVASAKARWDALFAKSIKLPPGAPDSTDLIREDRDSR